MTNAKLKPEVYENERMIANPQSNAWQAHVTWSPLKSIWITVMSLVGFGGILTTFTYEHVAVFLFTSALTLCLGHSLGMHRRFIHNSYDCPKWLEYLFVYFGVLVGLAGPVGMMHTHDLRDWAQRQKRCHRYFGHQSSLLKDAYWQLHCDIRLHHAPVFAPGDAVAHDRFYAFLERTWMWQQLPVAILLLAFGGLNWVIWGVCLRVAVSVTGHWLIGYFAHNRGHQQWRVKGAAVQGFNIKFCGFITMGECWHNNHHAYPGSALLGINKDQTDPGWWVLCFLKSLGLAWNIRTPEDLPPRPELITMTSEL